jgi:hypothetical protein
VRVAREPPGCQTLSGRELFDAELITVMHVLPREGEFSAVDDRPEGRPRLHQPLWCPAPARPEKPPGTTPFGPHRTHS